MSATGPDELTRALMVLAAFGPALPLAAILSWAGRRTVPPAMVGLAIACGFVAAIFGAVLETSAFAIIQQATATGGDGVAKEIPPPWALFIAFLAVAVPEELAKLATLKLLLRRRDVDAHRDAAMLMGWIGLGFATLENFGYVTASVDWPGTAALRACSTVPFHVAIGLVAGHIVGRVGSNSWFCLFQALAMASLLHAAYDALAVRLPAVRSNDNAAAIFAAGLFLLLWFALAMPIRARLRQLTHHPKVPGSISERASGSVLLAARLSAAGLSFLAAALAVWGIAAGLSADRSNLQLVLAAILPLTFAELGPPLRRGG